MKSLEFVFKYAERYIGPLALTVASMLLLVGVQLLAPWIIRTMIATVTDPAAGPEALGVITRLALLALAVYVVRAGLRFVRSYMAHVAGWNVVADVRAEVYQHLQRLSLRFYEDKQTGQLMSRTVNDSDLVERLIAHAIPDVMVNVLMLIGVSAVLVSMSWRLAILSMMPTPLIVLRGMRWGFASTVGGGLRSTASRKTLRTCTMRYLVQSRDMGPQDFVAWRESGADWKVCRAERLPFAF